MRRPDSPTFPGRGEERLLGALAAGLPIAEAATEAGLSARTVYRRLATPGFQQRLAAVRDELVVAALGELAGSASEAVATLRGLLDASDERVRLQAARVLLEQLLRLREAVTLEQRVAALERNHHKQRASR